MTGNTVLLGVAEARGDGGAGARSAVALCGFSLGVILGTLLIAENRSWPQASAVALLFESIVLLALLIGWVAVGSPSGVCRYVLLGGAGVTMGVQSISARAASGGGIATTYVTGTLTNALAGVTERLVGRSPDSIPARDATGLAGAVWLLYGAGALAGAITEVNWHAAALVVPTAIVSLIAAAALVANHRPGADRARNGRS